MSRPSPRMADDRSHDPGANSAEQLDLGGRGVRPGHSFQQSGCRHFRWRSLDTHTRPIVTRRSPAGRRPNDLGVPEAVARPAAGGADEESSGQPAAALSELRARTAAKVVVSSCTSQDQSGSRATTYDGALSPGLAGGAPVVSTVELIPSSLPVCLATGQNGDMHVRTGHALVCGP